MFLANAQALAMGANKDLMINGQVKGSPNSPGIMEIVKEYALFSCLIEEETDDLISVRIYEDDGE